VDPLDPLLGPDHALEAQPRKRIIKTAGSLRRLKCNWHASWRPCDGRQQRFMKSCFPACLENKLRYFAAGNDTYGLASWLLDTKRIGRGRSIR